MSGWLQSNLWLVVSALKVLVLVFAVLTAFAYLTWLERKVIARIQSRVDPCAWARTDCYSRSRMD